MRDTPQARADFELLKQSLISWLKEERDADLRKLQDKVSRADIVIERQRIWIGEWVYNPRNRTLTKYSNPGALAGYDYIYHVKRTKGGWERVDLEVQKWLKEGETPVFIKEEIPCISIDPLPCR